MKTVVVLAALVAAIPVSAQMGPCSMTMTEARKRLPDLADLPDDSFVRVVREIYYPDRTEEQVANALCVKLPQPWKPRELNMIDRWRFNSCQEDAAKAPTREGVNIGMRLCREKFGQ